MSIICTVSIEAAPDVVQKFEAAHPEILARIGAAAGGRFVSHRRLLGEDRVMDLDEFASRADYDAFHAEASESIKAYAEGLGAAVTDTIWEVDDTPIPD